MLAASMFIVLVPACDSTSFAPPRPAELAGPRSSAAESTASAPLAAASSAGTTGTIPVARAKVIELILSRPPGNDRSYLVQFLRRDTGVKKYAFHVVKPEKDQPMTPEQLARAIRTAAGRSTGGVVVEAFDAPEVRDALREAESKGLPLVLLDSPLPSASLPRPIPYVTRIGFAEAGKKIVEAVVADAELLRLPAGGTALVLVSREKDFYSKECVESMTSALKAAGRPFEILEHDEHQARSSEQLSSYLEAHPKVTMIFADREIGLSSAYGAREVQRKQGKSLLVLGGYASCDVRLDMTLKQGTEAIVDRNSETFARKTLQVLLDQIEGKAVPERNEVDLPFTHNAPRFFPATAEASPPAAPKPGPSETTKATSAAQKPR
jgi:ABC-type sugar transport system substrate-binding protein